MTVLRWLLALVLAAFFAYMGALKFGESSPVFSVIAERSGITLFEPVLRMVTGAAELLAALLLVIPASRRAGAGLALVILVGALGFHFSPWLGIDVPGVGPMLFRMALGAFALTLIVWWIELRARAARSLA